MRVGEQGRSCMTIGFGMLWVQTSPPTLKIGCGSYSLGCYINWGVFGEGEHAFHLPPLFGTPRFESPA